MSLRVLEGHAHDASPVSSCLPLLQAALTVAAQLNAFLLAWVSRKRVYEASPCMSWALSSVCQVARCRHRNSWAGTGEAGEGVRRPRRALATSLPSLAARPAVTRISFTLALM